MNKWLLILIFIAQYSCTQHEPGSVRARDPWIFRVNLDNRPRMIVLALNNELWAAYDAQHSKLYKLWKGGIRFNGPMYDDRHNVQPSAIGLVYSVDSSETTPWSLAANGSTEAVKAEYTGYTVTDKKATIQYRIPYGRGKFILIRETPEYITGDSGKPGFQRTIETSEVPAGTQVMLGKENINANGPTVLKTFYEPLVIKPAIKKDSALLVSKTAVEDAGNGKKLIEMNDCAACHTTEKKEIGPSFRMIAEKYNADAETVRHLAAKIIKGGSGVWGRQEMTPHAGLSDSDASSMVSYILSLGSSSDTKYAPGIVADFYKSGVQLSQVPDLIPGQNPNLSTTVSDIEFVGTDMSINRITNDFFGFDDQFVMHLAGFIKPPRAGRYEFKLKANAGARFILNDKEVAAVNYSNYDYQQTEAASVLREGLNSFRIEYYEDIYSSDLSLRWKLPGENKFSRMPATAFSHDPGQIKKTSEGVKEIYEINPPGFGASLDTSHPSFDVTTVRPEWFDKRISDLEFLPNGMLAVSTWDSTGSIYLLENVLGNDKEKVKAHLFATGLYEVMGLEYVDGKLYALQKWELTELIDHDNDMVADEYRVATDDWSASANFHEWAFGLIYRDGYFYLNTGISLGGNGILTDSGMVYSKTIQTTDRGKTLKIKKSDWTFEAISHGYKAPNGIGFGVDDEIFSTDNEGHMVPTNKLMHVPQHGYPFFGNDEVLREFSKPVPKFKPPVIWMPTGEISNSPSQPVSFKTGPYNDHQMVVGDVHHGGLNRMFIEKIAGEYQGAIFPFTQGLEAGITRLTWGPDGNLYMAGLGAGGDFGHKGHCCGLQRFVYNGKSTLDMLAVRARSNGMEIEFTEPLRAGEGIFNSDYTVQQFWYETGEDVMEGGVKNDIQNLPVRSVNISGDRKKVFLEIPGMKKEQVIYIKINRPFLSAQGHRLWTGQAWYTLNNIPDTAGIAGQKRIPQDNVLIPELKNDGWNLLSYEKSKVNGKTVLISMEAYKNFELEFDWKASQLSDAGVFIHVPSLSSFKESSAEMQLIDDDNHSLAKKSNAFLSGGVSGSIAPKYKLARSGSFNHARLVVKKGHVEHWINGILVAEYDARENSTGRIAFMTQQGQVDFKNIRVRDLK